MTSLALAPRTQATRLVRNRSVTMAAVVSAAFSTVFIWRSAFEVRGDLYFSLRDDAMISMVYARNLVNGDGFVWNPGGAAVEGITNPLWTLLMAGAHVVAPERLTSLVVMVIGAALLVAAVLVSSALVAEIWPGARLAPSIAAWLVAMCYPLVFWTLRGMEVGLVTVLTLLSALLAVRIARVPNRRDSVWLVAVAAVGIMTRFDFAVVVAALVVYLALAAPSSHRWRIAALLCTTTAVVVGLMTLWRFAYFDSFVPNTYELKVGGVPLATRLGRGSLSVGYSFVTSLGAAVIAAAPTFSPRGLGSGRSRGALLLVGIAAAQALYAMSVGGDAWEWMQFPNRYLTVALVVLLCLAAPGVESVARGATKSTLLFWMGLAAASIAVVAASSLLPVERLQITPGIFRGINADPALLMMIFAAMLVMAGVFAKRHAGDAWWSRGVAVGGTIAVVAVMTFPALSWWLRFNAIYLANDAQASRYGLLLAEITEPDARVAVTYAGAPVYFSHRAGIDLLGKNDSRIAELESTPGYPFWPGHSKWDYEISILDDRPDVIAQLFRFDQSDIAAFEGAGYVHVVPTGRAADLWPVELVGLQDILVRASSDSIRWDRLKEVAAVP